MRQSTVTTEKHVFFFFSSRRRHTRSLCDWSSDVCSSDLMVKTRRFDPGVPETAKLIFEYPAAAVKATSLDHPSVQRAVEQTFQLFGSSQSTLYLVNDHYVRSEERRVGKSVNLDSGRIIKK